VKDKDYKQNLHRGAKPPIFENARALRQRETVAEKLIWSRVRNRKLNGRKFRRQHAIDRYILDFYCHECRLAVELDGGGHLKKEQREYDELRSKVLGEHNIKVIRFQNEDVINDLERVLEEIVKSYDHIRI
jgi:very-short-patch-repair endonuclease